MVADLKYFDGTLSRIDRIPADLRAIYATAFEVDATWLVEAASRRQKWIDQAQSLNIYIANPSGKKLDALYKLAWSYYRGHNGASTIALARCQYQSSACVLTSLIGPPFALRASGQFALAGSQLPPKRGSRRQPLQASDAGGRLEVLRTALAARALRVARMAAGVTGNGPPSTMAA